jgi:glycolate oxidase iron-sulfur subunit
VANIQKIAPEIIATGNLGCMTQIGKGLSDTNDSTPIVHTVELLDWITGGPTPKAIEKARLKADIAINTLAAE